MTNIAILVLLYDGVPIWTHAIDTNAHRRTEMVSVQWKDVLKGISAYCTVFTETVCEPAGIPSVETVADECKRGYTALCVELVQGVEKHGGSGTTKGE